MKLKKILLLVALMVVSVSVTAQNIRVFSGGASQRPDLMRKLFDEFEKKNPGSKIDMETGGATSEAQRQYLSTVLNAKDSAIDLYMIDIVNPMQYARAGWLEPLDAYLGAEAGTLMKNYLPAYASADVVDGKIVALPAFADAQFLYYRKDLFEKYGVKSPATWDDLAVGLKKILDGEKNTAMNGVATTGAAIEGAVCSFLKPYWSQGKDFNDAAGKLTLDRSAAVRGLQQWLTLVDVGVIKKNVAEVKTPDTVNEFKAGQAVFAINWSWAWDRFADDADSKVKGKVGVMPLPAMAGGKSATCVGGWQWAVSAFSKRKAEAAKLVQFMAGPEASKYLAIEGALLPTSAGLYTDADVLKSVPWFKDAAAVVVAGRSRPLSRDYGQVSDVIRTTTSAVLARTKTPEEGVGEIASRLARVMR